MNKDRYEIKAYLKRLHILPNSILRHGSFDSYFGIRTNYILTDVKAWLVWNGIDITSYRD